MSGIKLKSYDTYRFTFVSGELLQFEFVVHDINRFQLGFISAPNKCFEMFPDTRSEGPTRDGEKVYVEVDLIGLKQLVEKLNEISESLGNALPFDRRYFIPMWDFGLSSKTNSVLHKMKIKRLGDLIRLPRIDDLFGKVTDNQLEKIRNIVTNHGLKFGTVIEGWELTTRQIDSDEYHDAYCYDIEIETVNKI